MLVNDPKEAARYFAHFFDATMTGVKERDQFVSAFLKSPPKTVLGYPRSGAELPCYAIVLQSDEEAEGFLADYTGQTDDQELLGAMFESTYAIFVNANHPDIAQVLYQLAKGIIHAGKGFLLSEGVEDIHISGGDLAPDESFMPENMFVRVLRVNMHVPYSAPAFLPSDPRKIKVLVYGQDVVVDGIRGGVRPVSDDDETA